MPLWVVSPYAHEGVVTSRRPAEHVSTLKLIERTFGLPTLASLNHRFDKSRRSAATTRRTERRLRRATATKLSDLYDLFDFG